MSETKSRTPQQIYFRQLPGGGFVTIDVTTQRSLLGRKRVRGEVIVERRADVQRRQGHSPPAIADAEAATTAGVFHQLYPVAHSDVAVATGCLARERRRVVLRRTWPVRRAPPAPRVA